MCHASSFLGPQHHENVAQAALGPVHCHGNRARRDISVYYGHGVRQRLVAHHNPRAGPFSLWVSTSPLAQRVRQRLPLSADESEPRAEDEKKNSKYYKQFVLNDRSGH